MLTLIEKGGYTYFTQICLKNTKTKRFYEKHGQCKRMSSFVAVCTLFPSNGWSNGAFVFFPDLSHPHTNLHQCLSSGDLFEKHRNFVRFLHC